VKEGGYAPLAHLVLHVEPGLAAQSLHHDVQRRPRLLRVLLPCIFSSLRPCGKCTASIITASANGNTLRIQYSSNELDVFRRPMQPLRLRLLRPTASSVLESAVRAPFRATPARLDPFRQLFVDQRMGAGQLLRNLARLERIPPLQRNPVRIGRVGRGRIPSISKSS